LFLQPGAGPPGTGLATGKPGGTIENPTNTSCRRTCRCDIQLELIAEAT
jgi:hypothetical protein